MPETLVRPDHFKGDVRPAPIAKDPEAIRQQLELVLADPLFRNSKRYPGLLRYVVDAALSGSTEPLKERTLGIHVFGRNPDYDTNLEPVVRTTAVEIRKRLSQYYSQPGRELEIRIDLPVGSYVPEFHLPPEPTVAIAELSPLTATTALPEPGTRRPRLWWLYASGLAALALIAVLLTRLPVAPPVSALDRFWKPVLQSSGQTLLCIGGPAVPAQTPSPGDATTWQIMRSEQVALSDATALALITGYLQTNGKPYAIRGHTNSSFADFRNMPTILIGAFDNQWTLRFTSDFRFTLHSEKNVGQSGKDFIDWIQDRKNPTRMDWSVNNDQPYLALTRDYAIVARVVDPNTQRPIVIAAGLMKWGTVAAGEFLSDKRYMEQAVRQAPADWDKKNIEIVIGTSVFNGVSGPPQVLATWFW